VGHRKSANLLLETLDLLLAACGKPSRLEYKPTTTLGLTFPSVYLNPNTNPTAADQTILKLNK